MTDASTEDLLRRYPALIADAARHGGAGWSPDGGEAYKAVYRPTAEAVERFASHVFGGIGFEAADYMIGQGAFEASAGEPRPSPTPAALKGYLAAFNDLVVAECRALSVSWPGRLDDWVRLIAEDGACGGMRVPVTIGPHGIRSSLHALRVGWRAIAVSELMRERARPIRTLVEIGGGHGRVCRDLVWMLEPETAFYVDLPFNLLLAARFLRPFFGDRVNLVWSDADPIVEGGINITAPWLIERIETPVDLLANFFSFQHMPARALAFYGERLIEPRVCAIYHHNREQPRNRHEVALADYPFRRVFPHRDAKAIGHASRPDGRPIATMMREYLER